MTLQEENKQLNELITKGYYEDGTEKETILYTLKDKYIYMDDFKCGPEGNTVEKRMNFISRDARRAFFIEEILKSVGIIINDIEINYDVICTSDSYIVFLKKEDKKYTFIEFSNSIYYGENLKYDSEIARVLRVIKLDLNNNDLIYDQIDFENLKHYHADSKISDYTLDIINKKWATKNLTQNDLYDIIAYDVQPSKSGCAWNNMNNYGEVTDSIDTSKLDKNICYSLGYSRPKIYYL